MKWTTGVAATPMQETKLIAENVWFVGVASIMQRVRAQAEVLAKLDVPVLIVGESGTGKEVIGQLIHNLSNRSRNRFLKISCAALDLDALERGFLRDKKSKSTDETEHEISPFLACDQGTILLGDIDELPARAQARLLYLLQDKHFFSGRNPVHVDVRILGATTANVKDALLNGKLRKDLYYFLSAFTVVVPPLRQRKDDIPLLLEHFMARFATDYGLPRRLFSPDVLLACEEYSWPGNISELEKFVKRYLVSGDGQPWSSCQICSEGEIEEGGGIAVPDGKSAGGVQHSSIAKSLLHSVREEAERNVINSVLLQTRWNRRAAARLLNVSYRTLLYKIQQYHLCHKNH